MSNEYYTEEANIFNATLLSVEVRPFSTSSLKVEKKQHELQLMMTS